MPDTANFLDMRHFGALLEAYIGEAGFSSLSTFADAAGTTPTTISRCVRGIVGPPLDQLDRWASALKLSGRSRSDFVRAGWRAKAWTQQEALPWIKHTEAELLEGKRSMRQAEREIQSWIRRAGQLEQVLKERGIPIPPHEAEPPPEGGEKPQS